MQITETQILNPTDTFFDENGELVCCTKVINRETDYGNFYIYTGMYCTGPKAEGDREFPFYHADIHKEYPEGWIAHKSIGAL